MFTEAALFIKIRETGILHLRLQDTLSVIATNCSLSLAALEAANPQVRLVSVT